MSRDNQIFIILILIALVIVFLVTAGLWWVVLWGFGFPIFFMWKQVFGIMALTTLVRVISVKKETQKEWKEIKKQMEELNTLMKGKK